MMKIVYQCEICRMTTVVPEKEEQPKTCNKMVESSIFKAGKYPRCGGALKEINRFSDEKKAKVRI